MHLSISNFKFEVIEKANIQILLLGLLLGVFGVLFLENFLRHKGLEVDIRDSAGLWASERQKATEMHDNGIILVGNSRIQLGVDIGIIENTLHKKVAQLAIDGEPWLPVLIDLANDEKVTGTIIIGGSLFDFTPRESPRVNEWISNYHKRYKGLWLPSVDEKIRANIQHYSVLSSNIIPPLDILKMLFTSGKFSKNYLVMYKNRTRDADYSLVDMPDFYLARVLRTLGSSLQDKDFNSYELFSKAVIKVTEEGLTPFDSSRERFTLLEEAINKLQKRGVKVFLINFPVSGLVEEIDNRRFPKESWDKVVQYFDVKSIDYRDYQQLRFWLADGSHLDYKQKKVFTKNLVEILNEK